MTLSSQSHRSEGGLGIRALNYFPIQSSPLPRPSPPQDHLTTRSLPHPQLGWSPSFRSHLGWFSAPAPGLPCEPFFPPHKPPWVSASRPYTSSLDMTPWPLLFHNATKGTGSLLPLWGLAFETGSPSCGNRASSAHRPPQRVSNSAEQG